MKAVSPQLHVTRQTLVILLLDEMNAKEALIMTSTHRMDDWLSLINRGEVNSEQWL